MPSPLAILLNPISLGVIGLYAALILWERLAPARPLPRIRGWIPRAVASFTVYFYLSSYLPLVWDRYLAPFQLFDLTGLGTWGGAAVGLLAYEALLYAWHRSLHASDVLWHGFHQMHHSAERLEAVSRTFMAATAAILPQDKAQRAPCGYSTQASCNAVLRQNGHRPDGLRPEWLRGGVARHLFGFTKLRSSCLASQPFGAQRGHECS